MTAATTLTVPAGPPVARSVSAKQLWRTGAGAGLAASVATSTVAAGARALDVSLKVGAKAIPLIGFAQLTFVAALIGTVMAVTMSRRADRPRHTFLVTTIALTVVSIVPDLVADAHTATRFMLALTHLVAAAIVIPAITARLSD